MRSRRGAVDSPRRQPHPCFVGGEASCRCLSKTEGPPVMRGVTLGLLRGREATNLSRRAHRLVPNRDRTVQPPLSQADDDRTRSSRCMSVILGIPGDLLVVLAERGGGCGPRGRRGNMVRFSPLSVSMNLRYGFYLPLLICMRGLSSQSSIPPAKYARSPSHRLLDNRWRLPRRRPGPGTDGGQDRR